MSAKKYTELDFDQIKQNLKDFLKGQPEFQDYNFEGSGINLLLDILAYNTGYNAFYANMIANEMFLDTALLRSSVISRAKALGYNPTTIRMPYAKIKVDVVIPLSLIPNPPEYIVIPLFHEFTSQLTQTSNSTPIKLYTLQRYIIPNVTSDATNWSYSGEIEVFQGQKLIHTFDVDEESNPGQRYILPNTNIDGAKIFVEIKPNSSSVSYDVWARGTDITNVGPTDKVYFVQECEDQFLELYFGDGFIGKKLENGNEIKVTYFVTDGTKYHGIKKISVSSLLDPSGLAVAPQYITLTTLSPLSNGSEPETVDQIKYRAPLYYDTQARAVTKSDYETLLMKDYPQIEHVRVWGGEDNIPPRYGVVYISAKPKGALSFNTIEKQNIIQSIIKPRSMVSIETEILDPEYLNITLDVLVRYEGRKNNLSPGEIESLVRKSIDRYAIDKLSGFDTDFRYSSLLRYIDNSDSSIVGNSAEVGLKYTVLPSFNIAQSYNFSFQSQLDLGDVHHDVRSVLSSPFIFNGFETLIGDDGNGNLFSFRNFGTSRIIVQQSVGTVDYNTGNISIPALNIQGIPNGNTRLYFFAKSADKDFFATRNRILIIDQNDVKITVINENR